MDVVISVDVEQDCPPFLHSCRGAANSGLQYLMDIFELTGIKVSFFVGADVVKLYPNFIQGLEIQGHEIGCHDFEHRRFDQMSYCEAEANIRDATRILGQYLSHPVRSFRAPNLHFPKEYLSILKG
ncbi:MAG: polysaccharide deacetylase family protein [Candidatus Poribacteria bacterium]